MPDVSGNTAIVVLLQESRRRHSRLRTPGAAYRHGRSIGIERAAFLLEVGGTLHHLLSHAISAVFAGAISHSAEAFLRGSEAISWLGGALHGEHGINARGIDGARLRQSRALA